MEQEKQIHPLMDERILDYCNTMHSNKDEALMDLQRQTYLHFVKPNMISSAWQGEFLMLLTKMIKAKRVLEIGTFSGYSTTCFAKAMQEDGVVDTIECMQEYEDFLIENFKKNKVDKKINIYFGQGLEVVKTLSFKYDIIFLDAEKAHYKDYFPLLVDKLNQGGLLIADNILWYGKVVLQDVQDKQTQSIREFNRLVTQDARLESVIVPIRDGLIIGRRL